MMNIQPIQISGIINISESNYNRVHDSHKCMMFRQGFIPFIHINKIRCPYIYLFLGIVPNIDFMDRIMKKHDYLFQVTLRISSYFHCALKFEMKNRKKTAITIIFIAAGHTETMRLIKS